MRRVTAGTIQKVIEVRNLTEVTEFVGVGARYLSFYAYLINVKNQAFTWFLLIKDIGNKLKVNI
ncbi:hypothetical protein BKP37_07410 [Anaerobacillus alkalilacustris]|uniref:Uncharacterized protein n=1 Tax=Anaerobacillus alkalilacustris TaxID=393763 RepID=A0A1S2LSZ2_9BACI|nr:hypothetical protein BKP37_07410 [Anaerobacillus alkalilacustris]